MITTLLKLEYHDRLRDGTDKINTNFEALRLYVNGLSSPMLFTGESTSNAVITLKDHNNLGFRLADNSTTLFKGTVVATNTDEDVSGESGIFEVAFGIDVRKGTPVLIGGITVFAYHDGLPDWEIVGVDFDGPYMSLEVKAKDGVGWSAFLSATSVDF